MNQNNSYYEQQGPDMSGASGTARNINTSGDVDVVDLTTPPPPETQDQSWGWSEAQPTMNRYPLPLLAQQYAVVHPNSASTQSAQIGQTPLPVYNAMPYMAGMPGMQQLPPAPPQFAVGTQFGASGPNGHAAFATAGYQQRIVPDVLTCTSPEYTVDANGAFETSRGRRPIDVIAVDAALRIQVIYENTYGTTAECPELASQFMVLQFGVGLTDQAAKLLVAQRRAVLEQNPATMQEQYQATMLALNNQSFPAMNMVAQQTPAFGQPAYNMQAQNVPQFQVPMAPTPPMAPTAPAAPVDSMATMEDPAFDFEQPSEEALQLAMAEFNIPPLTPQMPAIDTSIHGFGYGQEFINNLIDTLPRSELPYGLPPSEIPSTESATSDNEAISAEKVQLLTAHNNGLFDKFHDY